MSPIDRRWIEVQIRRWGVYVRLGWIAFGIGIQWDDYSRALDAQAGVSVGRHSPADDEVLS